MPLGGSVCIEKATSLAPLRNQCTLGRAVPPWLVKAPDATAPHKRTEIEGCFDMCRTVIGVGTDIYTNVRGRHTWNELRNGKPGDQCFLGVGRVFSEPLPSQRRSWRATRTQTPASIKGGAPECSPSGHTREASTPARKHVTTAAPTPAPFHHPDFREHGVVVSLSSSYKWCHVVSSFFLITCVKFVQITVYGEDSGPHCGAASIPLSGCVTSWFTHANVREPLGDFQVGIRNPLLVFGPWL